MDAGRCIFIGLFNFLNYLNSAKQNGILNSNSISDMDSFWNGTMWFNKEYATGNLPFNNYGYIISYRNLQIAIPYSGTTVDEPKFRCHANGRWQPWRMFCDNSYLLSGGTRILPNYNLNNYKTPGNYYITSNGDANLVLNTPVKSAGTLKVEYGNGTATYPRQTYITYNGVQGFIRYFDGANWSSWKTMFSS